MKELLKDERIIKAIWGQCGDEAWGYAILAGGVAIVCDKIECYGEPGEYCYKPWFAIWKDGKVTARVNANFVSEVIYN